MKSRYLFFVISALLFFFGCENATYSPRQYARFVESEKSGLRKTIAVGDWRYTIQYTPADYILLKEVQHDTALQNSRAKQLEGTAWFNLTFKNVGSSVNPLKYNISTMQEYEQRYNYFLSKAMNDFALIYGQDTLRPVSYVFETSYNLAPQETMVVGFALTGSDRKPVRKMQLVFFDRVFRNGIIKATYDEAILNKLSKIQLPSNTATDEIQ